jgi:hypothetical protein
MLYLFELMANASLNEDLAPPIKEPNVPSASVSETATVLPRFLSNGAGFHLEQKMGTAKMNRRDWELLDKQTRRISPPRNDGVIAVMLAAMFLVGITLGSILSPHESAPTQIASIE